MRRLVIFWMLGLAVAGCAGGSQGEPVGTLLPIAGVESEGAERALLYYAGGVASPEGADPIASGVLVREDASYSIDLSALPSNVTAELTTNAERVDWEAELKPAFQRSYAQVRELPASLGEVEAAVGAWADGGPEWFVHEVDGVMTAARRRLFVPMAAAREAALAMAEGRTAAYPLGTVIVGEHWADGRRVETTLKRKRGDGHWDFAVYDAEGSLTDGTATPPRPLAAPAKCIGCHLGSKLHQPEKAFPAEAPSGPFGPREVHVPDAWRAAAADAGLAQRFQEHARRADGVLGLYGTLYAARVLAQTCAGEPLVPEDSALVRVLASATSDG